MTSSNNQYIVLFDVGTINIKSIENVKTSFSNDENIAYKRKAQYEKIVYQWKCHFKKELEKRRNIKKNRNGKILILFTIKILNAVILPFYSFALVQHRCITLSKVNSVEEITDLMFDHIVPMLMINSEGMMTSEVATYLSNLIYKKFCAKFKEETGASETVRISA